MVYSIISHPCGIWDEENEIEKRSTCSIGRGGMGNLWKFHFLSFARQERSRFGLSRNRYMIRERRDDHLQARDTIVLSLEGHSNNMFLRK
jgi:hypothetical protein